MLPHKPPNVPRLEASKAEDPWLHNNMLYFHIFHSPTVHIFTLLHTHPTANMAAPTRKPPSSSASSSSAQAEIFLLPTLKSCLLNLPSALVAVLLNSNTLAQNVIVEISFRVPSAATSSPADSRRGKGLAAAGNGVEKRVWLGWTGMQSQGRLAGLVGREGGRVGRGDGGGREGQEVAAVEVDATFGRLVGLSEGMKVGGWPCELQEEREVNGVNGLSYVGQRITPS